ncbi:MAG: hypothetical protein IPK16_10020 [Anaerolineales bacterium]|nr:hypothetical protein [Anaerolineales bacterium]
MIWSNSIGADRLPTANRNEAKTNQRILDEFEGRIQHRYTELDTTLGNGTPAPITPPGGGDNLNVASSLPDVAAESTELPTNALLHDETEVTINEEVPVVDAAVADSMLGSGTSGRTSDVHLLADDAISLTAKTYNTADAEVNLAMEVMKESGATPETSLPYALADEVEAAGEQ